MRTPPFETAVHRLRALTAPPAEQVADGKLLERYLADGDQASFAVLVQRHGPAVLGVCQRVLANRHDAEDAFQATFQLLARNANSIRQSASVGSWLHGVAFRVSSKSKRKLARQPHSIESVETADPTANELVSWREIRRILDEELHRLPDNLRIPLSLCYLEGLTRDEAAQAIGCKPTTLRGRLEDGRDRLRLRLARRGVDLSAALLAISAASDPVVAESLVAHALHNLTRVCKGVPSLWMFPATFSKLKFLMVMMVASALVIGGWKLSTPQVPSEVKSSVQVEPPKQQPDVVALARQADRIWVLDAATKKVPEPIEIWKGMTKPDGDEEFKFRASIMRNLPRTNERYIVFLKSIDEATPRPKIEALPGDTWYVPYSDEFAKKIRAESDNFSWGEESSGLRMGLRSRLDDEMVVEVAVENVSKKSVSFLQHRDYDFDNWPNLEFSATDSAGKTWRLERSAKPPDDALKIPAIRRLQPGERYIHVIRLMRWAIPPEHGVAGNAPAKLFLSGDEFKIGVDYRATDGKEQPRWWIGRLSARPITVKMPWAGQWGKPVDEFRTRLRVGKKLFREDEKFEFELDLLNEAKGERELLPLPFDCTIKVDERRIFGYFGALDYKCAIKKLLPGKPETPFISVKATELWTGEPAKPGDSRVPLRFSPGKHSVRVGFPVSKTAIVYSQPVEIQVLPREWGLAVDGVRSHLRLPDEKIYSGAPLTIELDVTNESKQPQTVAAKIHLVELHLDGNRYEYRDAIRVKSPMETIAAGQELPSLIVGKVDKRWVSPGKDGGEIPFRLTPGDHALAVSIANADGKSITSNLVEFTAIDDGWGDPVDGIQTRLRIAKSKWKLGESIEVHVDLRNGTSSDLSEAPSLTRCSLQFDRVTYPYSGTESSVAKPIIVRAKSEANDWLTFPLDPTNWSDLLSIETGGLVRKSITFPSGMHQLNLSYALKNGVKPITQTMEFEVEQPMDLFRWNDEKEPRLYVILTDPKATEASSQDFVVKHLDLAVAEAKTRGLDKTSVIFFVRTSGDADTGNFLEFTGKELQGLKDLTRDDVRRVVVGRSWKAFGKLPKK